jgi:hypothetical protein
MKYRTRTYYTDSQRALMWEPRKRGQPLQKIDSKPVVNTPIKNARKLPEELYKEVAPKI